MNFNRLKRCFYSLVFSGLLLLQPVGGSAKPIAPDAVRVEGAIEKPGDWTKARLEKEFGAQMRTIHYSLKGQPGTARCLSLLTLIEAAQPRLKPKIKHHLLSFIVVAQAKDGYRASFSLGELLPANGKHDVWIALDQDGKPLMPKNAPAQLIVPDDKEFSRWVHGVTRLTVIDGAALPVVP